MFDVGFFELVLLFVIGLLILGPERLPRVASQVGRWIGRARRTANQLRYQLERETSLHDIKRSMRPQPPKKPKPAESSSAAAEPGGDSASEPAASASDQASSAEAAAAQSPDSDTASKR